jgi:hypothetical protein
VHYGVSTGSGYILYQQCLTRLFTMRTKLGLLMHWDESYPEQDEVIIQSGPPSGSPASNESIQSFLWIRVQNLFRFSGFSVK